MNVTVYDVGIKDEDQEVGRYEANVAPASGDFVTLMTKASMRHFRVLTVRHGATMFQDHGHQTTVELFCVPCDIKSPAAKAAVLGDV